MALDSYQTYVGNMRRMGGGVDGLDTLELLHPRWNIIARRSKDFILQVSSGYPVYTDQGISFPPDDNLATAFTHITLPHTIKKNSSLYAYISFGQNFDVPLPIFTAVFTYFLGPTIFDIIRSTTPDPTYIWTGSFFIQIVDFVGGAIFANSCVPDVGIGITLSRNIGPPAQDVLLHEMGLYYEVDQKAAVDRPYS